MIYCVAKVFTQTVELLKLFVPLHACAQCCTTQCRGTILSCKNWQPGSQLRLSNRCNCRLATSVKNPINQASEIKDTECVRRR